MNVNTDPIEGVLFVPDINRKQINEFKKVFARSVNLSKVDSKRWKLSLKKDRRGIYFLYLYFDDELIDFWGVLSFNHIRITISFLEEINVTAEKMFKEEWVYGIKDKNALESMIGQSEQEFYGIQLYPTIIKKAAYYWYHIATKQMFHNGNKRTALLTGITFLGINGYNLSIDDTEMLYNISLDLANHSMNIRQLEDFIFKNVTIDFEWMSNVWGKVSKEIV